MVNGLAPRSVRAQSRPLSPPILASHWALRRVFIVTEGVDLGNGFIWAESQVDVTDQFDSIARGRGWTPPDATPGS